MGVRGLRNFITKECPEACKFVSIKELAENHRISQKCEPVLVVDGKSLLYFLYQNASLEWIYGGQWIQFLKVLENFISQFRNAGVKLVFIFDGTICEEKRKEWKWRRVCKYDVIASIFGFINEGRPLPRKCFVLPTSMGVLSTFALKELGAEVYQTDRDADTVIAEYANNHKEVFGILSEDTDFIIYNTKMCLTPKHGTLKSLQIIHYDRDCFASRYLHLDVSQLPLFACFNGNGYVPSEKLKAFHLQMSKNRKIYIAAMVENMTELIRKEKWTGDVNNLDELEGISRTLFDGDQSSTENLRDGLNSYLMGRSVSTCNVHIKASPEFQQAVYERHLNCQNLFIFNLMCKLEVELNEALEDLSSGRLPAALVYREIRQRCYGVLFNQYLQSDNEMETCQTSKSSEDVSSSHCLNEESVTITEWCAFPGNEMPEDIKPLPLKQYIDKIPTIEEVWFKFTKLQKMKLFCSILQLPMGFETLIAIPQEYLVLACILNYLIGGLKSGSLLKPWEVAVFVSQALRGKNETYLESLKAPPVDPEAVNLSTLFMRGVTAVFLVHGTCNAPFPVTFAMPWHFFDGKLFHHVYVETKNNRSIKKLCCGQDLKFYKLLSIVIKNTSYDARQLDWKNKLKDFTWPKDLIQR